MEAWSLTRFLHVQSYSVEADNLSVNFSPRQTSTEQPITESRHFVTDETQCDSRAEWLIHQKSDITFAFRILLLITMTRIQALFFIHLALLVDRIEAWISRSGSIRETTSLLATRPERKEFASPADDTFQLGTLKVPSVGVGTISWSSDGCKFADCWLFVSHQHL